MKLLLLALAVLVVSPASAVTVRAPHAPSTEIYQVTSAHPHELKEFQNDVETVEKKGRLWLVKPKNVRASAKLKRLFTGFAKISGLRPLKPGEALRHYTANVKKSETEGLLEISAEILASVNQARIEADVTHLASAYRTRAAGTDDNRRATEWLKSQLATLQLEVRESCYRNGRCSVIAERKGTTLPDEVILVMAHFDSVGRDFAGADDNATGSAALLEMARTLNGHTNRRTVRYFLTNGEEDGLLGAKQYAEELARSRELPRIVLAINMDMVGYNSNRTVELETSSQHESLANWFAALAQRHTGLRSKITIGAWGSDHVPFLERGVPTLLTIEEWDTKTPCYHAACDKPDTVNYAYATEIAKLNVAAVLSKDAQ